MGNILSGSEVAEIGIQIEKNGRDFYNTFAKQTNNQKVQEIFKFLAQEEEKHIQVFQGLLDKTEKYEPQGLDVDNYFAYLSVLAGEHIFTQKDKGEEAAQAIKTDKEAVEKAICFEKDSIVFYAGIRKIVPDYDQKIIEALIAQEESHLKQLLERKIWLKT